MCPVVGHVVVACQQCSVHSAEGMSLLIDRYFCIYMTGLFPLKLYSVSRGGIIECAGALVVREVIVGYSKRVRGNLIPARARHGAGGRGEHAPG